jgi:uncharacterized protein YacL
MPRTFSRPTGGRPSRPDLPAKPPVLPRASQPAIGTWWDLLLVRGIFAAICVAASYYFRPFGLAPEIAALVGLLFFIAVILFEIRLERATLKRLIGAAIGSVLGILGAYLMTLLLAQTAIPDNTRSFLGVAALLVMGYIGLVVGAHKGDMLNLQALGGLFGSERSTRRHYKVFDTSVIIDGRIADICEAQFLDGTLMIPQFVLRELQMVADSSDSLKRQRGRRGLEVLQRIQQMPHLTVEVADEDFPQIHEVDLKLIELAKRYDAKIVTNDFNLNKVASLQGIDVLNVNALANSLKPVVLPGEPMRVFILREGKEYNQGVAYLDDGTMVVVDNARKMINRTVDISVTSVHQTSAGKMIFGRFDERGGEARLSSSGSGGSGSESYHRASNGEHHGSEHPPRPAHPDSSRE